MRPYLFINYRDDDAGQTASRLYTDLIARFNSDEIFIDHQRIGAGTNWAVQLCTQVQSASVFFLIIGPHWLILQDKDTGDRRLNVPDDWVRREIETALASNCLIVPILADGAPPLNSRSLQTVPTIARIAALQALPLRRKDWDADLARLIALLASNGFTRKAASWPIGEKDKDESYRTGGPNKQELYSTKQRLSNATCEDLVIQEKQQGEVTEPRRPPARLQSHASGPTRSAATELQAYSEGLERGDYVFNVQLDGHEARRQLGFGQYFATAYNELREWAANLSKNQRTLSIEQIIEQLRSTLREEIVLDEMATQKDQHFAAICYLRGLQNATIAFPNPNVRRPTAAETLRELQLVLPNEHIDHNDANFHKIYELLFLYARDKMESVHSVSIYEIIAKLRQTIVEAAVK